MFLILVKSEKHQFFGKINKGYEFVTLFELNSFYSGRLGPFSLDFKMFSTSSNLKPLAFRRIK